MLQISQIHEVILQSGIAYCLHDLLVSLSDELDLQSLIESRICCALLSQDFPKHRRITISCKEPGVGDAEIRFRSSGRHGKRFRMEIILVESVSDELYRRLGHGLELLLHQRRHSHDSCRTIQHFLLHPFVPSYSRTGHLQVLEIEYLCPWIPEIGNPREAGLLRETKSYHMHGLRRSRADNQVYRMLCKILLEISDRRTDPEASRVRTEKISTHPHRHLLQHGLVLCIHRIDFHGFLAMARPAQNFLVHLIRLDDPRLENFRLCRHLGFERCIDRQLLRILRGIDHRLPSFGRKILGEFDPPLHSRTACRRPVI